MGGAAPCFADGTDTSVVVSPLGCSGFASGPSFSATSVLLFWQLVGFGDLALASVMTERAARVLVLQLSWPAVLSFNCAYIGVVVLTCIGVV